MTELSFLIDLLMNHKLSKATKELVAQRIKEVESRFNSGITLGGVVQQSRNTNPMAQSASTIAALAKQQSSIPHETHDARLTAMNGEPAPVPVEQIAQTPATQAAMAHRQALMIETQRRPVDPATGRPRKW